MKKIEHFAVVHAENSAIYNAAGRRRLELYVVPCVATRRAPSQTSEAKLTMIVRLPLLRRPRCNIR